MAHEVPSPPKADLMKLFDQLLGAVPPPTRGERIWKAFGTFVGRLFFVLFSVSFVIGLLVIGALLVHVLAHLL